MSKRRETRQHIVDAAGRLFRQHGIDAVGVDAIMHAAGLTHGGFYGHFASKEALVAEVAVGVPGALGGTVGADQRGTTRPMPALERIVGPYLDPAHVAEVDRGCVLTTLGPEVARRPEARPGIAASVRVMANALGRCLPEGDDAAALAALSTMVGAVVLARLADSSALAETILAAAKRSVLRD